MEKKEKSTILIVDDKPANILSLENLLESKERQFLTAANGTEALQIALNREVDLIILDVQMPNMDGFEVARILNLNKRTKDIPVIFASAEKKEQQSMLKGFKEGAVDYLSKPFDPEIVKAKVSAMLKLQLQKKELIEKNISLEKSELLINNCADIIGIIDSSTFKIEEINKAFTSLLGYTLKEAKESSLLFFLSNEDRLHIQELGKKKKDRLAFETQIYCKDRSIKWLQWNIVIKYQKWFVNARDITEIKQVEKIRNYLAAVVKQSKDAIYIHDHEGQIISWNEGAEAIYGYTEAEALKMKIWNIIPDYIQSETDEIVGKILSGEKIQDFETKRITKHGKFIDVLFSASAITKNETGQVTIAITERDITHQKISDNQIKQLNSDLQNNVVQLESANKELESFSYSVSHDLRAPLRAINGYAKIMEEDYLQLLDNEAKKILDSIMRNSERMGILIDDLLEFSRLGKKKLQKASIDMEKLVKNVITDLNSSTPNHAKIIVNKVLPAEADYSLIYQVWVNLISNAIKYSSKKHNAEIEINSIQHTNEITYYVKDNGAGFNMEYIDKLFGVFQRLHREADFKGTGVGLAIVQRIVSKHGGKIWAEGKENEGATFYFTLPFFNS